MELQFSLTKDCDQLYPGLRFEDFQLFVRGFVSKLKPGDRLRLEKDANMQVVVQRVTVRPRDGKKPEKQEAILDVKYATRDKNANFPVRFLKKRAIFLFVPRQDENLSEEKSNEFPNIVPVTRVDTPDRDYYKNPLTVEEIKDFLEKIWYTGPDPAITIF